MQLNRSRDTVVPQAHHVLRLVSPVHHHDLAVGGKHRWFRLPRLFYAPGLGLVPH